MRVCKFTGRVTRRQTRDDRYQFQPWYIKLWRRRHQLVIPYMTFRYCWVGDWPGIDTWKLAWRVAVGEADYRMNWLYTLEEVKERLGRDK
jgi:hypothetical protein